MIPIPLCSCRYGNGKLTRSGVGPRSKGYRKCSRGTLSQGFGNDGRKHDGDPREGPFREQKVWRGIRRLISALTTILWPRFE